MRDYTANNSNHGATSEIHIVPIASNIQNDSNNANPETTSETLIAPIASNIENDQNIPNREPENVTTVESNFHEENLVLIEIPQYVESSTQTENEDTDLNTAEVVIVQ